MGQRQGAELLVALAQPDAEVTAVGQRPQRLRHLIAGLVGVADGGHVVAEALRGMGQRDHQEGHDDGHAHAHQQDLFQLGPGHEKERKADQHDQEGRAEGRLQYNQGEHDTGNGRKRHQTVVDFLDPVALGVEPMGDVENRCQLGQLRRLIGTARQGAHRAVIDPAEEQ